MAKHLIVPVELCKRLTITEPTVIEALEKKRPNEA